MMSVGKKDSGSPTVISNVMGNGQTGLSGSGIKKYAHQWIQDWCNEHGWTDLFLERYHYWAFPPGAVMPQPIPGDVLYAIKQEKGLSPTERWSYGLGLSLTTLALIVAYLWNTPMPLAFAFGICAVTVAYLEDE